MNLIVFLLFSKNICLSPISKVYFKNMVNRILKAFSLTCLVFLSIPTILAIGVVFRIMGESFGYHNSEVIGLLFLVVFIASYVFIGRTEK